MMAATNRARDDSKTSLTATLIETSSLARVLNMRSCRRVPALPNG